MGKDKRSPSILAAVGAVILIVTIAGVFLVAYTFDGPGFGKTWPALPLSIGLVLMLARYIELGLVVVGLFGMLLMSNLDLLSFRRAWPLCIVIVAIAVLIGFLRARAGKAPGPESTIREKG